MATIFDKAAARVRPQRRPACQPHTLGQIRLARRAARFAAGQLLRVATVVVRDINNALDLLLKPRRLLATLRR